MHHLPTPPESNDFFDSIEEAIYEMERTRPLSWIESKATELDFYPTFLLAVVRLLALGRSREQMKAEMNIGFVALIKARSISKRQTCHVIYRIALKSRSPLFIEKARQKGLLGWYQHRRLKTRCKNHEDDTESGETITESGA